MNNRVCFECHKEKPETDFCTDSRGHKDRTCKACRNWFGKLRRIRRADTWDEYRALRRGAMANGELC